MLIYVPPRQVISRSITHRHRHDCPAESDRCRSSRSRGSGVQHALRRKFLHPYAGIIAHFKLRQSFGGGSSVVGANRITFHRVVVTLVSKLLR
jgi:hypothetical protein